MTLCRWPQRPGPAGTGAAGQLTCPPGCCLLVVGGSCQRAWEHCVPKTALAAGPRISVQFGPGGVR